MANKNEEKEIKEYYINKINNLQKENKQLKDDITTIKAEKQQFKEELFKLKKNIANRFKILKIILIIIFIFSVIFILFKIKTNNIQEVNYPKAQEYSLFIENWNTQVRNITEDNTYLLSFSNNSENIEKLNNLLQNFYIAEITDSIKYNKFLEKNKLSEAIILNSDMKENELLNKLKEATNEIIMSAIVKKILIMNSKKYWKEYINDN